MSKVERWLLPDGIEEILPREAQHVEHLRRQLLDLFHSWGYDLVIPPMVEFTDSLLIGQGHDVDLLTCKVTDQMSGRSMGIRADITPQAARMDAHSLKRNGVNRLCYAGHVMYNKPKQPLGTRTPIQVGVELFGEPGLDADIEVISLLLETLRRARLPALCIDLGHVGIYRALAEAAGLTDEQEHKLFGLLQAKAMTEIKAWVAENINDATAAGWFLALPQLSGNASTLAQAQVAFDEAPAEVAAALDELQLVAEIIGDRYPEAQLYFDLSELRGYQYLTGMVFAAFAPGVGNAIARGGRYDHIGEVFGRARSATGFAAELVALQRLGQAANPDAAAIFAPPSDNPEQWQAIQALRAAGERVVSGLASQPAPADFQACDRQLVEQNGIFTTIPLA
jgi:ATP phosphoribosyltransferase regulatory subunit